MINTNDGTLIAAATNTANAGLFKLMFIMIFGKKIIVTENHVSAEVLQFGGKRYYVRRVYMP